MPAACCSTSSRRAAASGCAPIGPGGDAQLCRAFAREAARWGNGSQSLGLKRGDRVLLFLDDTPAYPAAFFGAVRRASCRS